MNSTIVTEGELDKVFLQAILTNSIEEPFRIVVAGGWSSADSLARSLLIRGEHNVAIVVDADSTDPNLIDERKRFLQRSLGVMAPASRFHVMVVAPEIEGLIFNDRKIVEDLIGDEISDTDFVHGQFEPKETLSQLFNKRNLVNVFAEKLPGMNLDRLRTIPEISDLLAFLRGIKLKPHALQAR